MTLVNAGMTAAHLVFAALWIGGAAFVAFAVLPLARDGNLERHPLDTLLVRFVWISRISALALIVTGSHLMGTYGYFDTDQLLGTGPGQAVLSMLVGWLLIMVLVEVGTRRIRSGLKANLIREPARDGAKWYALAALIGIAVFTVGGLLAGGAL